MGWRVASSVGAQQFIQAEPASRVGLIQVLADMRAWLQSSDLSVREFETNLQGALDALARHDWSNEEKLRSELERQGQEYCDSGLGLVREDGRILHVCPGGETSVVHFHRPVKRLGFLWQRSAVLSQPSMPSSSLPELVRYFFEQKDHLLERIG